MNTLTLEEAAKFLHIHPITLLNKANSGEVPGCKPGKRWVFIDIDLAEYLRSKYTRQMSSGASEETPCHSTKKKDRKSGMLVSKSPEDRAYAEALGLPTRN